MRKCWMLLLMLVFTKRYEEVWKIIITFVSISKSTSKVTTFRFDTTENEFALKLKKLCFWRW